MRSIAEFNKVTRPERVIQFGEGGFLRGFADWMLHKMNKAGLFDGSVVVVQPIEKGLCDLLTSQNCLYTHLVRSEEGVEAEIIDIISRCVKPYEDFEEYLPEELYEMFPAPYFKVAVGKGYITFEQILGYIDQFLVKNGLM